MSNSAKPTVQKFKHEPRREVLALEDLSFRDATRQSLTLRDVNLTIREGQLVTLLVSPSVECRAFTSMLQGLRMPQQGRVVFDGKAWTGDNHIEHDWMRSQIGRVFDGTAWIENMNIFENVTMSQRHHTNRSINDLHREVQSWSKRFEIEDMANQRPAFVGKTFLRICEWVRAFLGSPKLLLLEHPMRSVPSQRLPILIDAITSATQRGAAVFWIAGESELENVNFPSNTAHYRVVDFNLVSAN